MKKIRVGIIGTGRSADVHINFVRNSSRATVVGIVDFDELALQKTANRFRITDCYTDISEFIEEKSPDVVHVVTPVAERLNRSKEALEKGVNVIVESPMALDRTGAEELYEIAGQNGLLLCPTHQTLFTEPMTTLRELVSDGAMGRIHSVDVRYGIDTRTDSFKEYPGPNRLPWPFELPGSIYQNFLPAPLSILLGYIGSPVELEVMSGSNGVLPQGMVDEVSVLIKGEEALGTLTLSFAPIVPVRRLRIYGTRMTAEIDLLSDRLTTERLVLPARRKRTYNIKSAYDLIRTTLLSLYSSIRKRRVPLYGLGLQIDSFYTALASGGDPPVSKVYALEVLDSTESIYKRLKIRDLRFDHIIPAQCNFPLRHKEKLLVTGATGFFGSRLVERLVKEGYEIRVLARKLSDISALKSHNVEIFYGDVADPTSLVSAMDGIDLVIHAAASTKGNECHTSNIIGTANVVDACHTSYVDKVIYLSSCSVYDVADKRPGQIVTEESACELVPEKRGEVNASKQKAESILFDAMENGLRAVVLRPARIYGPGAASYTPEQCLRIGKTFITFDNGKFEAQIVHIDNLVDAVLDSIQNNNADGEVFNVVDNEHITTRQYMNRLIKNIYPNARILYVPYPLTRYVIRLLDYICKGLGRSPFYNRYSLESSLSGVIYDGSKLRRVLDWKPRIRFDIAAKNILEYEQDGVNYNE